MAIQFSVSVRDAMNDAVETVTGTAPKLQLWSGTKPTNCAAADAGDGAKLVEMTLPSDWMAASSSGTKSKSGTWSGAGLPAAGTGTNVTHFRLKNSAGTTCHMQGSVTGTSGGGDMTMDNVSVAEDQTVTVDTASWTAGDA